MRVTVLQDVLIWLSEIMLELFVIHQSQLQPEHLHNMGAGLLASLSAKWSKICQI